MFNKICKECGSEFTAKKAEAKFCAQACRLAFNNRRRDRGAISYDVLMNCRYNRDTAKDVFGTNDIRAIMSDLAAGWAATDCKRPAKKTWQGPGSAKDAMGTTRGVTIGSL